MHSSQNEQDNRRYAVAAGVPMFEPADAQEAYDYTHAAVEVSERWGVPVLLRVTTRVCHTTALVRGRHTSAPTPPRFSRNPQGLVMIPAHARPAHKRLRAKLDDIQRWNEKCAFNAVHGSGGEFGIITSGVCYLHAREAAPNANILKLGMTHPLPIAKIRNFRQTVERCWVIEENDPYLAEAIRAAGIEVECAPAEFRFGELNVDRVRRILTHATAPDLPLAPGRPPQLCQGCPHRVVFETLRELDVIVAGDIGCYTLGVLPPFEAMDTMVEMGAAIGVGLGLRHALPPSEAQRVVSVIGDSTFIHSGITGLVEMVYNPPATGHVVIILDNGTTAMTGLQEHPGTGRALGGRAAAQVLPENLARAVGIQDVTVVDAVASRDKFSHAVRTALAAQRLSVIIVRRPCLLLTRHRTTAGQEA
jgi:indolepyruvate ferredoxin oxidoreductase alpha subunit